MTDTCALVPSVKDTCMCAHQILVSEAWPILTMLSLYHQNRIAIGWQGLNWCKDVETSRQNCGATTFRAAGSCALDPSVCKTRVRSPVIGQWSLAHPYNAIIVPSESNRYWLARSELVQWRRNVASKLWRHNLLSCRLVSDWSVKSDPSFRCISLCLCSFKSFSKC